MEYDNRFDRLKDPGESFMREIDMLMTDTEHGDIPELLSSVGSELPRILDEALDAEALSDNQRSEARRRLGDIRDDVDRLPNSDEKTLIMQGFESLLQKLAE